MMVKEQNKCGIHEADRSKDTVQCWIQLKNLRRVVTGGQEKLKQENDLAEWVCLMVKSSQRYLDWEYHKELSVSNRTLKWIHAGIFSQCSDL